MHQHEAGIFFSATDNQQHELLEFFPKTNIQIKDNG